MKSVTTKKALTNDFESKPVKRKLEPIKKSKVNFKSPKFWKEVYEDEDDIIDFKLTDSEE